MCKYLFFAFFFKGTLLCQKLSEFQNAPQKNLLVWKDPSETSDMLLLLVNGTVNENHPIYDHIQSSENWLNV